MGLSDTTLGHLPWPELLQRIVAIQRNVRLSLRGDLSQHDIVMRIMRKDDYLIGVTAFLLDWFQTFSQQHLKEQISAH